jgi:hypothetical protein
VLRQNDLLIPTYILSILHIFVSSLQSFIIVDYIQKELRFYSLLRTCFHFGTFAFTQKTQLGPIECNNPLLVICRTEIWFAAKFPCLAELTSGHQFFTSASSLAHCKSCACLAQVIGLSSRKGWRVKKGGWGATHMKRNSIMITYALDWSY